MLNYINSWFQAKSIEIKTFEWILISIEQLHEGKEDHVCNIWNK